MADLLAAARQEGWSEDQLHVAIADRVGQVGQTAPLYLDFLLAWGLCGLHINQVSLQLQEELMCSPSLKSRAQ